MDTQPRYDVYLRWPLSLSLPELARERIAEAVTLRDAQHIALTRCPAGARPLITDHDGTPVNV